MSFDFQRKSRLVAVAVALVGVLGARVAAATTTPTNIPDAVLAQVGSGAAGDLLTRVDEALNAITYTYYSESDVWSPLVGIYKVVCAGYVNHILDEALPVQYDKIKAAMGKSKLGVWDYHGFFGTIAYGTTKSSWKRIANVADLRPGDLVVWQYDPATTSASRWGHIVVIASKPVRDTRWSGAYKVRVSDSTSSAHSVDNRGSSGSGVGAGEMLLRAGSTGRPYQFAWTTKGYWRSDITSIRMARPM